MVEEIILSVLEIIGTVAFAVSGSFVAIKARLDLFGVLFVGCITAVGGGIFRDMMIGAVPPLVFSHPNILLIALLTSAAVFVISYILHSRFDSIQRVTEQYNNIFDALGLAAFSVSGTELAFVYGIDNGVLAVIIGLLSGVGGGIMRDVLTASTPYIFKKHIYALASLFGAALYYGLRVWLDGTLIPSVVALTAVFAVRMLATKYRWSLPKIRIGEDENEKGNEVEK